MSDGYNPVDFETFREKALKDPEVAKEYEALGPIYELRSSMIELRKEAGVSQETLAKRMGTQKSNISRLEAGGNVTYPTFKTISKYAEALGYRAKIVFEQI